MKAGWGLGQDAQALARARRIKAAYGDIILGKANVVGVGIGFTRRGGQETQEIGLIVLVTQKLPRAQLAEQDVIPHEIEGVPVDVQAVGELRPSTPADVPG